ncbi:MAG: C39 family peptidase [bacterium]|nr:C39 family peptidase [bacterium]
MTFYMGLLVSLLTGFSASLSGAILATPANDITEVNPTISEYIQPIAVNNIEADIPDVPFYSQFNDISSTKWQKLSCGIADLAMIIEFYNPGIVSPDILLQEGITAGAFIDGAGWSHKGLALLVNRYDLVGTVYDLSSLDKEGAFIQFEKYLQEGPVIASVYYKFDPQSPIPHLVVINGVDKNIIYYNDPAGNSAGEKISIQNFLNGWKKRFIVIRPAAA